MKTSYNFHAQNLRSRSIAANVIIVLLDNEKTYIFFILGNIRSFEAQDYWFTAILLFPKYGVKTKCFLKNGAKV
jgi:hypothetical protein